MAKELQISYSGIFPQGDGSGTSDGDSIVEITEGKEPGCSRDMILVATDSFDDIAVFLNNVKDSAADSSKTNVEDDARLIKILRDKSQNQLDDCCKETKEESTNEMTTDTAGENTSNNLQAEGDINLLPEDLAGQPSEEKSEDGAAASACQSGQPAMGISFSSFFESSTPDWHSETWRQNKKHVFILSCAGKPIYTRYGDADQQASLFGALLTLSQFLQHTQNNQIEKDMVRSIQAGQHTVVFLTSELMVMVIVSQTAPDQLPEPVHSLVLQLTYVYNQIISVLSSSRLKAVYEQRPNFDLRRLLSGSEKFIDSLLKVMDRDPGFLLSSVRCLPIELSVRENVAQTIALYAKIKDLVFALLITGNQLIALVRMKQFLLHPVDLHILFNLVSSSESFKQAESWSPVCLPKFDPNGYLHCHISYLDDDCQVCLLLLSVDKDSFYTLSECRNKIKEKLIKTHMLQAVKQSLALKMRDPGMTEILHFIYKARSTGQFVESDHSNPYNSEEEKDRLFSVYRYVFCLMHAPGHRLKIYFHVGAKEAILGWITAGFELFAVFSPLTTKAIAIQLINKLLKWIKKEENKFFILNSHTF